MTFPLDDIQLGPRSYGLRKGTEAVVLHTMENAGPDRESALATIRAQSLGGSLYSGGGSYHFVIHSTGVILSVPFLESAGSLIGNHTLPQWRPDPEALAVLSAAAQADTNAYVIAVAFSGRAADLAALKLPLQMFDTCARLIRWIEEQPWAPDDIPVLDHEDFQTDRTDPGPGVNAKVIERYRALYLNTPPAPNPAVIDHAGQVNAFGTLYPSYVHTDAQALAWVNRRLTGPGSNVLDLYRRGILKLG